MSDHITDQAVSIIDSAIWLSENDVTSTFLDVNKTSKVTYMPILELEEGSLFASKFEFDGITRYGLMYKIDNSVVTITDNTNISQVLGITSTEFHMQLTKLVNNLNFKVTNNVMPSVFEHAVDFISNDDGEDYFEEEDTFNFEAETDMSDSDIVDDYEDEED